MVSLNSSAIATYAIVLIVTSQLRLQPWHHSLSFVVPRICRIRSKKSRSLYRVNQYRPRIPNIAAVQLHVALIIMQQLPNQHDLVEVHRTRAVVRS